MRDSRECHVVMLPPWMSRRSSIIVLLYLTLLKREPDRGVRASSILSFHSPVVQYCRDEMTM